MTQRRSLRIIQKTTRSRRVSIFFFDFSFYAYISDNFPSASMSINCLSWGRVFLQVLLWFGCGSHHPGIVNCNSWGFGSSDMLVKIRATTSKKRSTQTKWQPINAFMEWNISLTKEGCVYVFKNKTSSGEVTYASSVSGFLYLYPSCFTLIYWCNSIQQLWLLKTIFSSTPTDWV